MTKDKVKPESNRRLGSHYKSKKLKIRRLTQTEWDKNNPKDK